MGLFDRFKKRLSEVVDDVDTDAISAEGDSNEALDVLEQIKPTTNLEQPAPTEETETSKPITDEDDWEILDDEIDANSIEGQDEDW